jgi:thiamine-monophosphate kinase
LHGGDDYELLFTVPPSKVKLLPHSLGGMRLQPIGKITRNPTVRILDDSGGQRLLTAGGWDPFR